MNGSIKKVILGVFLLTIISFLSHAQVIPTGKLDGTVMDENGVILPGVTVTIKSPALISPQMVSVTNNRGYYRFTGLPSGEYQVKAELPGFKTIISEGIIVTVSRTATLDFTMEQSTIEEVVTVFGKDRQSICNQPKQE